MVNGRLAVRLAQGALMGAANTVPGVSGGTLALMFGIYEKLISGIQDVTFGILHFSRDTTRIREVDWRFLLSIAAGASVAVVLLAGFLETGLAKHPEEMAGLFLGLVVASIIVSWRLPDWNRKRLLLTAATGISVFVALGWQWPPIADPSPFLLFLAGAVTICAMILPGLSGSFLLLMFGLYESVLAIIDNRSITSAAFFCSGAILGLALFSSLLTKLLKQSRDTILAVLIGLMIGSLRVLWPWPNGVGMIGGGTEDPISGTGLQWPPFNQLPVPVLLAAGAFTVVLIIDRLSRPPI